MSLTKIQPYSLDSANDFSSLVDSVYAHANSAYNTANNSTDTWVRNAANSASSYANSAYTLANTNTTAITSAGGYANSAYIHANAAYAKANTGGASGLIFKSSATTPVTANIGDQWYSTTEDILYEYLSDGTSNAWVDITSSSITATAATSSGGTNNARSIINSYIFGS